MASLRVLEGELKGQTFELTKPLSRIGRREVGNDWVLADPSVSGMHCEVERTVDGFLVRDIGSTNGTKVNGVTIREQMLTRDDVIAAGDVTFAIEGDDVPVSNGASGAAPIARTTIVIRPNADAALPDDFKRKSSSNALWLAVIGVLLAACAYFAYAFFTR